MDQISKHGEDARLVCLRTDGPGILLQLRTRKRELAGIGPSLLPAHVVAD